ncbi:MAG TPA: hypothetical protein VIM11_10515 [Tepidisphaeraceae bacterium]|jgi:hypothetical protein
MRKRGRIIFAVLLPILLGTALCLHWLLSSDRLRKNWTAQTIPQIAALSDDRSWLAKQTSAVATQLNAKPAEQGTWLTDQFTVMRDGQYIIFKNECVHRHQLLGDIFIAKASNGRWYYSSFHFCCEMVVPRMERQPADLETFIDEYFLKEFDGNTDSREPIKPTWTPGSTPVR